MERAQKRGAVHSEKFYFRKHLFPPGSSRASSAENSGANTPVEGTNGINGVNGSRVKDKKMRNCWPTVPPPADGFKAIPVDEEYEELTINQIMNGKASRAPQRCNVLS